MIHDTSHLIEYYPWSYHDHHVKRLLLGRNESVGFGVEPSKSSQTTESKHVEDKCQVIAEDDKETKRRATIDAEVSNVDFIRDFNKGGKGKGSKGNGKNAKERKADASKEIKKSKETGKTREAINSKAKGQDYIASKEENQDTKGKDKQDYG
jgi:hypothetical protein